jgi:hypothetical protein
MPDIGPERPPPGPVVQLTAEQDHQRLLELLHIKQLRPGVSGDPKAPNAANADEAKANPYPMLPDPLKLKDGKTVATSDIWWQERRQEIADDYENLVYGQVPAVATTVNWVAGKPVAGKIGNFAVMTRQAVAHISAPTQPPLAGDIRLSVSLPAHAKGSVPVLLLLAPGSAKPGPSSTWREQVLAKGWGVAILDVTSIQPDDGADMTHGVIGIMANGHVRGLNDWGVLRAWAWGASRAMDYFESDSAIDAAHVGIAGHSRYGKAALVAMAYDPRFVVAYISSSGAGGADLLRRNFGERIENLAAVGEYHWFAGNFLQYAGSKAANDLPVDAHELIALCAPRGVFIGAGSKGDDWVDPRGMFMAEVAAGPVYRLLGHKDLGATVMPRVGKALVSGDLAFRQHEQGHTMEPNWPYFLSFAQRYLAPARKKG